VSTSNGPPTSSTPESESHPRSTERRSCLLRRPAAATLAQIPGHKTHPASPSCIWASLSLLPPTPASPIVNTASLFASSLPNSPPLRPYASKAERENTQEARGASSPASSHFPPFYFVFVRNKARGTFSSLCWDLSITGRPAQEESSSLRQ
jgi:hypothetical protein